MQDHPVVSAAQRQHLVERAIERGARQGAPDRPTDAARRARYRLTCLFALVAAATATPACTTQFSPSSPRDAGRDGGTDDAGADARTDAAGQMDAGCGNGVADPGEACDGLDLGGQTCMALGFGDGTLQCDSACALDTHLCVNDPACVGSCSSCSGQATEASCTAEAGCSWSGPACGGTCAACDQLTSQGPCDSQGGCSWVTGGCAGACQGCSTLADQSSCLLQRGCSWGHACTGTPTPCAQRDQSSCTDGCSWDPEGPCTGDAVCWHMTTQITCEETGHCSWTGSDCTGSTMGSIDLCGPITSPSRCNSDTSGDCSWDATGPCSGTPTPCAGRPDYTCANGCTLPPSSCSGSCQGCATLTSETLCAGQLGCAWTQGDICQGACDPCAGEGSQGACDGQQGCAWQPAGSCDGACTPCETYPAEDACGQQPGCHWYAGR